MTRLINEADSLYSRRGGLCFTGDLVGKHCCGHTGVLTDLLKQWAEVQKLYAKAKTNTDCAILYETARTEHALSMLRLCRFYGVEVGE